MQGNLLRYANDPHVNPFVNYAEGQRIAEPNFKFAHIVHEGWPYIVAYALQEISKNDEILVEYGRDYWDGLKLIKMRTKAVKDAIMLTTTIPVTSVD